MELGAKLRLPGNEDLLSVLDLQVALLFLSRPSFKQRSLYFLAREREIDMDAGFAAKSVTAVFFGRDRSLTPACSLGDVREEGSK